MRAARPIPTSSPLATVTLDSQTQVPSLTIGSVTSGAGALVALFLQFTQAGTPATLEAELSVDLLVKE